MDRGVGPCLGVEELQAVAGASPGQVPAGLAQHLAACASCQARLLATDLPERSAGARKARHEAQPLGTLLVRALLVLAAILVALYSIQRLLG